MKSTLTAIALALVVTSAPAHANDQYWSDHYRMIDLQDQIEELQEDQEQMRLDAQQARQDAEDDRLADQLLNAPIYPAALAPGVHYDDWVTHPVIPGTNDPRECQWKPDPNYKMPPGFAPLKTPPQCRK